MYQPTTPPSDPKALGDWALRELTNLSRYLSLGMDYVPFVVQDVEPVKKWQGMTVFADGTNWNPGGGAGLYQYLAGSWVKL